MVINTLLEIMKYLKIKVDHPRDPSFIHTPQEE